jgi:hypothetical protein
LTDYDALADFIPALAVSERLPHPSGDAKLVRLRQVLLLSMWLFAQQCLRHPSDVSWQIM